MLGIGYIYPQYVKAAGALAQKVMKASGATLSEQISFMIRALTGRRLTSHELATLEALYHELYENFRSGRADARKLFTVGDVRLSPELEPAACAALTVVAQALLNYDEAVMNR